MECVEIWKETYQIIEMLLEFICHLFNYMESELS